MMMIRDDHVAKDTLAASETLNPKPVETLTPLITLRYFMPPGWTVKKGTVQALRVTKVYHI